MLPALPGYPAAQSEITRLVGLYGDLQVYKHIHKDLREDKLLTWWELHKHEYPDLRWNEFAAATGSTLGMFTLFAASLDPGLTPARAADPLSTFPMYAPSIFFWTT